MAKKDMSFVELTMNALDLARKTRLEQGIPEEEVEVEVIITRDEVRQKTGAIRVHKEIMDEVADLFKEKSRFSVTRGTNSEIIVRTLKPTILPNKFASIDDLVRSLENINKGK